ncbi:MAG: cobalamin-binding protein [Armatimonadota bacterium]|nr:cobalamin-binding protein [bacterium]
MLKKWVLPIGLVCMFALSVAAHAGYPMKVKDARGKAVTIKAKPVRIVSLTPSNTEILFALGLDQRIVGVTKYCNYPARAMKKAKIGDMAISVEAVVALKPDLVVAHALVNDSVISALEKLGLTVFAVDPKTISQLTCDIRTLGKITARTKTAESVVKKMQRKIAAVKSSRAKKKQKNVLVVIQADPLWAAGPHTFIDEMIGLAHAKNVARDARPGFVTFSRELAVSRNPDVIVVGSKGDERFFLTSPAWKTTPAAKNKRVYVINNDFLVRPGPRLADGLNALAKALDR